jgi:hypothetical protein
MSFSYRPQASAPMQNSYRPSSQPQQPAQPTAAPQQPSSQQTSPFSTPDMSAYSGARTPATGARVNNLSGSVPANQLWAQAYNQASAKNGGTSQAQSWTMPGAYLSQAYNPTTGQYSAPTGGQSWDGNMAHNAIDQRPGPVTANATGVGGDAMSWQDAMTQREAFVGNLSQRLQQYSGGQLTGPKTFDPNQLLSQANDQLANGTFRNPFTAPSQESYQRSTDFPTVTAPSQTPYNPAVQRAIGNSTQYMQGTQWQNPFGDSIPANNPRPSFAADSYTPSPTAYPVSSQSGQPLNIPQRPGRELAPDAPSRPLRPIPMPIDRQGGPQLSSPPLNVPHGTGREVASAAPSYTPQRIPVPPGSEDEAQLSSPPLYIPHRPASDQPRAAAPQHRSTPRSGDAQPIAERSTGDAYPSSGSRRSRRGGSAAMPAQQFTPQRSR